MRMLVSMLSVLLLGCLVVTSGCSGAKGPATRAATGQMAPTTTAQEPNPTPVDPYMGDYEGTFTGADGKPVEARAEVIGLGEDEYDVQLIITRNGKPAVMKLSGEVADGKLSVTATRGNAGWIGSVEDETLVVASRPDAGSFVMTRVFRESPTAGLKPPADAVVLLAMGEGGSKKALLDQWINANWRLRPDGSMVVNGGDNKTKKDLGSIRLHLDFWLPYKPAGRGQGRGNSGVYLQDRYEVQVLDSYGLKPGGGDCGAVYGIATPKVNACLPPATWQTYDITFHAATFDANGKVIANPTITVELNGVRIHENVEMKTVTGGAAGNQHVAAGPLRLQDHGHRVRYRNIWFVPLED